MNQCVPMHSVLDILRVGGGGARPPVIILIRLYNKCYDRARQLIRCYEHLRMLRYFSLQLLRYNAPLLQMLRFS